MVVLPSKVAVAEVEAAEEAVVREKLANQSVPGDGPVCRVGSVADGGGTAQRRRKPSLVSSHRRRLGTELPAPGPHLIYLPCRACSTSSGGSCAGCRNPSARTV